MKYKIFAMLLFSRIYSTATPAGDIIKIATKRPAPARFSESINELRWMDYGANYLNKLYQCGHLMPNNDKQKNILSSDVLKIIIMLPYTYNALNKVAISTGGHNAVRVTWGDILKTLKRRCAEADDALKSPIQYFFPSYDIESPYSAFVKLRDDMNKDELASFAADFIVCDLPTVQLFKEIHIQSTFQSAWEYLNVENYKISETLDRELDGYYTPLNPERPFFKYYMIKVSKPRYAVAMFLKYVVEHKLQEEFDRLKQH